MRRKEPGVRHKNNPAGAADLPGRQSVNNEDKTTASAPSLPVPPYASRLTGI